MERCDQVHQDIFSEIVMDAGRIREGDLEWAKP
jgi:hypothetical protein